MWQHFYEHLKLKLFCSTFEIDNIRCNISVKVCIHYCNWQFFYALLQKIKTFTCLILVIDFCIYKCNWQILLPLFLYASLQITHFVLTTAIDLLFNLLWWTFSVSSIAMYDNFNLHYCNWKLFTHYCNEQLLYASLKVFINY